MTDSEEEVPAIGTGRTGGRVNPTGNVSVMGTAPATQAEPGPSVADQAIDQTVDRLIADAAADEMVVTGQLDVNSTTTVQGVMPNDLLKQIASEPPSEAESPETGDDREDEVVFGAGWDDLLDAPVPEPPNENTGSGEGGASAEPSGSA